MRFLLFPSIHIAPHGGREILSVYDRYMTQSSTPMAVFELVLFWNCLNLSRFKIAFAILWAILFQADWTKSQFRSVGQSSNKCSMFFFMKEIWDILKHYCWWTKSCTTNHDDYPIIYRVLTIPGGCLGFCPSTVLFVFSFIQKELLETSPKFTFS